MDTSNEVIPRILSSEELIFTKNPVKGYSCEIKLTGTIDETMFKRLESILEKVEEIHQVYTIKIKAKLAKKEELGE